MNPLSWIVLSLILLLAAISLIYLHKHKSSCSSAGFCLGDCSTCSHSSAKKPPYSCKYHE